ncbi:septin and tuftelin-interacting protein 1 homolog 1-like [Triticum dicoccoides]|uniref:septin and tuftelin-interacting protein 1 homolog 1-like n=1 Tax=Triticum dicoccoides TaxID=85692 RepID=UPI001891076C|nr:septin and tuftelin-interacting protein 1 homolog 1-like [Triticum dicoccoides]
MAMATLEAKAAYPSNMPGSLALTTEAVARMMRQWNYREGSGLGAQRQGIIAHLEPVVLPHPNAGIGHDETPHVNGLQNTPPVVEDEWSRRWRNLSRALSLERECCDKTLALLHSLDLQGDGSAETANALSAVVESTKVFDGERTPGTWRASLPPATIRYIVEEVITPRMAADAQEWEPVWDPNCQHWLRPWIPLVGHLPDSLYDTVESKLITYADHHGIVSSLKKYLHPIQWDTFARRHILPRLARQLRELRITPPKQMDGSLLTVMGWAPLVRAQDMVTILEAEFFDRWEKALLHWLRSARPSLGEAVAWCTGWRNAFTPELLADERVLARLEAGAAMVDRETQGLNRIVGYKV